MKPDTATWLQGREALNVLPWEDPTYDAWGHDWRSLYAEVCWLPVVGPSTLWLHRRLAMRLTGAHTAGAAVSVETLQGELGLPGRGGRHSPIQRSLMRLIDFGLAQIGANDVLHVRLTMPPLSAKQLERLPEHVRRFALELAVSAA